MRIEAGQRIDDVVARGGEPEDDDAPVRAVRGRALVLRASVRSDEPDAARLWIKVAIGTRWEEILGEPHPGDDTWRPLEAAVSVPPEFPGGELRIALLHAREGGRSEFADVTVSVR